MRRQKTNAIIKPEWADAEFRNEKARRKHEKHLAEYGWISFEKYVQMARALMSAEQSDDVDVFVNDAGYEYRYRKSTNDFAIGGDGYIVTMFKPDEGEEYWRKEKEREKV